MRHKRFNTLKKLIKSNRATLLENIEFYEGKQVASYVEGKLSKITSTKPSDAEIEKLIAEGKRLEDIRMTRLAKEISSRRLTG